jgi:hypothetical protein
MTRRMVTSDMWEDDFVGSLSFLERVLWIGLITLVDDQGRMINNPVVIKSRIFPYDENVNRQAIEKGVQKFEEAGKVVSYEAGGKSLLQIVNWWKHQTPQWPQESRYPAPDGWTDRIRQHTSSNKVQAVNWDKSGGFNGSSSGVGSGVGTGVPSGVGTGVPYAIEEEEREEEVKREREEEVEEEKRVDFSLLPLPETPREAIDHPGIQMFQAITDRTPGKDQYRVVIDTLQLLRERTRAPDSELIQDLKRYWLAWSSRKNTQTGNPYSRDGLAWLTEWAVNGEIPPESSNGAAKSKGQQIKEQNDAVIASFMETEDATQ